MKFEESFIKGVFLMTPTIFEDERGYFFESFNENEFNQYVPNVKFVQDNHSYSDSNVLRGLHCQKPPHSQGKLVRVLKGKVLDVIVDIDPNSPTYGKHDKFLLDDEKHQMLFLPNTMAHGFYTLTEAIFNYKCTNFYNKASETGLLWNDSELNIDWGTDSPLLSEKDLELPKLKNLNFIEVVKH